MADEHADPRRLVAHLALGWIGLGPHAAAAGLGEQDHRPGGGRTGLHHRVGNVLGLLERAPHEDAGPGGVQRPELVGRGEAPAVQHHSQPLGLLLQGLALGSRPSESTTMSNSSSVCFISGLAWTSRRFRVPGIS